VDGLLLINPNLLTSVEGSDKMKIKTQFLICIVVFSLILLIIAASVLTTEQQVAQLSAQEAISSSIEQGASNLNSISIDYFLYQNETSLVQWKANFTSLSSDLLNLKPSNVQQQLLANNVSQDLQNLNTQFDDVVSYLQGASRNASVRIDRVFQLKWSNMANQSSALTSDAYQLSQSLDAQAHQVNDTNILLIVSLVATFGAFLASIYLIVFRRTLKSVADLQNGINTIGSGNLEYVIETKRQDEITDLSRSFNKMTANLKEVTASKTDLEQAQASLRESEQRWSTTLASIGDAVIATDLSGKITFMNGVAEELTGWAMSEASLKHVKEIFNIVNEQTRFEVEDPVSKVLENGLIVGLANHTVLIRKDGTEIAIDDSGAPIVDIDSKISGVVLIFRDITERKKAEETLREGEQRLKFHAENIPLAVVEWDRDFVVTRWAGDAEKMFGWTSSETVGKPIMDLRMIYEPDIPIVEKTMGRLTSGETKVVSSNRNITKDGRVIYCTWYNSVLLDEKGKMVSVFSFVEDYTSRITAEKALEETNRNLEKLVEERTKQLRDSERLAAIGATAGMVGHDIRNPLQAITGDVYLAKTELAAVPESEEKKNTLESLQEIEKNIDYINKIVADLQDFARPLKPHMEEADLKLIISELLAKNDLPENVKVSVKVDSGARKVVVDSAYINRIMYNLVTNAVQAMPKGGKLVIRAYKDKKTSDAVITVEDTGVGIPENAKNKLFTPMFTTKSKGQGFGLAVIKRMTEALSGNVTFESQEGNGTKFTVRLPQNIQKKPDF
jgi:PAS domain S-box-containing protein